MEEDIYAGGSSYSGQSFIKTFISRFTLRYVWFFCSILINTTQLASSDKIVEFHGKFNIKLNKDSHCKIVQK